MKNLSLINGVRLTSTTDRPGKTPISNDFSKQQWSRGFLLPVPEMLIPFSSSLFLSFPNEDHQLLHARTVWFCSCLSGHFTILFQVHFINTLSTKHFCSSSFLFSLKCTLLDLPQLCLHWWLIFISSLKKKNQCLTTVIWILNTWSWRQVWAD